ncbi:MAG: MBOAT family protein, partial [Treponema sp.]|nr:MBOAT family protein [Treponema sp.]
MLFNSLEFIVFFPTVTLLYFALPKRLKNPCLLVASYFFYACWNPKYVFLLLAATLVSYAGAMLIDFWKDSGEKAFARKLILALVLLLNFSSLFLFKYSACLVDFIVLLVQKLVPSFHLASPSLELPVGISFFTFQAVGYTIDVFRKDIHAEKNLLKYALFVSFFPQLVAGPIERSRNLLSQLDKVYEFEYERIRKGLLVMLWGFFLKIVIADRAAVLVNQVYGDIPSYYGMQLIIATVCFAIQIYCDFMGYSTIARGAALVLGFRLTDNFRQPYLAPSVKDFWRRWHISLSTWLRDYLYIPLGGSRCSRLVKYRNILLTFLASGIWHGAGAQFALWGLLHGAYQIAEDMLSPPLSKLMDRLKVDRSLVSYRILMAAKTFAMVCFAWTFFRAESTITALKVIWRSLRLTNIGLFLNDGLFQLGLNPFNFG